jgi:DNA protecting protein DprA
MSYPFDPQGQQAPESPPEPTPTANLRSAAGLLALRTIPAIGDQIALRIAAIADQTDPLPGEPAEAWAGALTEIDAEIERCRAEGIAVISIFDEAYPERLRQLKTPPPVLYVKGDPAALGRPRTVALAGSREPGEAGLVATGQIVAALGESGWTIVAGLGKGVETSAHLAALSAGATAVAVLSAGLDQISPAPNRTLAQAIVAAGGAVVSPFRMALRPSTASSIVRNRLVVGLAQALIVSQAAPEDGAMFSALEAAEEGRPVLCPEPRPGEAQDEGLLILLESPARALPTRLRAWKGAALLAAHIGERPLARPFTRPDTPRLVRAEIDEAIAAAGPAPEPG